MRDTYLYPAIFDYSDKSGVAITFPDLPGCLPCADNTDEAVKNAKEALALHLYGMEEDKEELPFPTDVKDIETDKNQTLFLVEVYMPPFREKMKKNYVKKTLSIPAWLYAEAEHKGINLSQVLQNALTERLGLS